MSDLRTVVVINDFDYINGGAAKVAISTAKLLARKGLKIYFFSATNKKKENDENIEYFSTNQEEALQDNNKLRGSINGIYNIKAKRELGKLLDKLDRETTVIHIHGWMKALSSSIFDAIYKRKFKFVVTFHDYFSICPNGGFFNYKKNEICCLQPLSWKCIKCNCDSRNYAFKIYRVIRQFIQNKIVRINSKIKYAISISDFSYKILKDSFSKNIKVAKIKNPIEIDKSNNRIKAENNNYYLYVGRVSKEKGVNLFCEAITQLKLKGLVVGDGNQRKILQKEYSNIEFKGWKNKEEVKSIMENAKALIFPSLCYETAPLTTLEAQAIGLPCIISNNCAAIENIQNEKNGLIFNSNDINSLKEEILKFEKEIDLKELSKNCYNDYWNSKNEYEEELVAFYKKMLNDE